MTQHHSGASRATVATHSFERVLLAAVLVTSLTVAAVFAVAAAGVTVAFLAGAATAVVAHRVRNRVRSIDDARVRGAATVR